MADTFRITAYNGATDTATIVFNLDARSNFAAVTNGTQGLTGIPKDTEANATQFIWNYVDNYIAGKQAEAVKAVISPEVQAMLNVTKSR